MRLAKVRVTATREQLHEMGICSEKTFERLLSGEPCTVDHEQPGRDGRTLVWLNPYDEKTPPWLWVYKEFTQTVECPVCKMPLAYGGIHRICKKHVEAHGATARADEKEVGG